MSSPARAPATTPPSATTSFDDMGPGPSARREPATTRASATGPFAALSRPAYANRASDGIFASDRASLVAAGSRLRPPREAGFFGFARVSAGIPRAAVADTAAGRSGDTGQPVYPNETSGERAQRIAAAVCPVPVIPSTETPARASGSITPGCTTVEEESLVEERKCTSSHDMP